MEDPPMDQPEVEDGEEMEFPYLKADHPLLAKVQAAWTEQLTANLEKIKTQYREASDDLQKKMKHREDVGLTLYGAQQQLAKIQLTLETYHDNYATIVNQRIDKDENLKVVTGTYDKGKVEVTESLKRLNKAQDESNQLNVTLRQVEDYNTQMRAEIQITRRATYKAEDAIKTIEKAKQKQDLLIDTMNERIKKETGSKALVDAQLIAQRQETESAKATLRDAESEMDAISFEKKQLAQQWRSSLIGLQRRDEVLRDVLKTIHEQDEAEMNIDNEIRGIQQSIRSEQEKHENISTLEERNKNEMQYLQNQMSHIRAERDKLGEQYNMLKKSLDHTQKVTKQLTVQLTEDQLHLNNIEKDIQKVSRETTTLGTQIEDEVSNQTTSQRCETNAYKETNKVITLISNKENELLNLRNEISRVKVDSLNTKSHNQMLQERLREVQEDLTDKEKLIEQFDQEIRKRHHQIEKKQLYVDRLNREYDEKRVKLELEAGSAAAAAGPLEAKIKHMRKAIQDKIQENQELQKQWIQKQTILMQVSSDTDKLKNDSQEMKNQKIILDQKQLRINQHLDSQKKEVNDIELNVKRLRFEMDRWNVQLVKKDDKIVNLENSNKMIEENFILKLKDIEQDCVKMEENVQKVRKEKQTLQEDIVEAERQVMLWERKIHLEKEIHEALDPSVGQMETACMKKEIHRMELRRDQLKRRQEQMIAEMERCIHKRDTITLRHEPKKRQLGPTHANTQRQLESTKKNLRLCRQAAEDSDSRIRTIEKDMETIQVAIGEAMSETERLDEMNFDLQQNILVKDIQAQYKDIHSLNLERMRLALHAPIPPQHDNFAIELEKERLQQQNLMELIRVLGEACPQDVFNEDLWKNFYNAIPAM